MNPKFTGVFLVVAVSFLTVFQNCSFSAPAGTTALSSQSAPVPAESREAAALGAATPSGPRIVYTEIAGESPYHLIGRRAPYDASIWEARAVRDF